MRMRALYMARANGAARGLYDSGANGWRLLPSALIAAATLADADYAVADG